MALFSLKSAVYYYAVVERNRPEIEVEEVKEIGLKEKEKEEVEQPKENIFKMEP